ncbi:hypothetical protein LCGC14_1047460 [marine sediment metagenome]|uniref:Uncharacterized protein n=1 Tax=marine sediment metagenome TaxID=412755 RepID=A0A0F9Q828_9ZZZZ
MNQITRDRIVEVRDELDKWIDGKKLRLWQKELILRELLEYWQMETIVEMIKRVQEGEK